MSFTIREDDLSGAPTQALLRLHLEGMHASSPPGSVFALDHSGLRAPDVTVWTLWEGDAVLGIGALRVLADGTGEVKSMRTHPDHLRRGVAAALLGHIVAEARARGLRRLSLETGSGPAFDPALALYRRRGFVDGGAFGDYERSDFNQLLHLELGNPSPVPDRDLIDDEQGEKAMAQMHGTPCWYELGTIKGSLGAAEEFYGKVLGWTVRDSGMEGFDYHLAISEGDMVAGLMVMPEDAGEMPPFWMIYFAVDDADKAAADIEAAGGRIHRAPADIPGTGRFAVVGDPQGAGFGILQPEPMEGGGAGNAFDQRKAGHGNWNELMTTDPEAGFRFYSGLFGWQKSKAVDMGEMGTYQLFSHDGTDIGGMMGLGNTPVPAWLPYFGATGIDAAIGRIEAAGGKLAHGPTEVPGGAFIAIARDPQGAWFAVVGPKVPS